jgi:hypothetical protein
MSPVGFEPTIPARERPQTYALDLAATGTGNKFSLLNKLCYYLLGERRHWHLEMLLELCVVDLKWESVMWQDMVIRVCGLLCMVQYLN